jgi:hypothetical protein
MVMAGGKEIISLHMLLILLVLAAAAAAMVFYFRLRWLRRAARVARPAQDLPVGVEISSAEFNAMMADMEPGPIGDGQDATGQPFAIYRYRSRETGKCYDYIASAGGPRVIEYPAPSDSGEGVARSGDAP